MGVDRKKETLKLVPLLPLKHGEKLRKRRLLFETVDANRYDEIESKILAFKKDIEREVKEYIKKAT